MKTTITIRLVEQIDGLAWVLVPRNKEGCSTPRERQAWRQISGNEESDGEEVTLPRMTKEEAWEGAMRVVPELGGKITRTGDIAKIVVKITEPVKEVQTLPCMSEHRDGAHCGLTDWYPEIERGLRAALKARDSFTTGWYSSKKEIASARITGVGGYITVEVSVSDDDDYDGKGAKRIRWTEDTDRLSKAIHSAWDAANREIECNRAIF